MFTFPSGAGLPVVTGVILMLQTTRMWISRLLTHPQTHSLTCGIVAGTAWVAVCAAYWSAFDPVASARATFALAWVVTISVMRSQRVQAMLARIPFFWRVGAASCGFAAWPTAWKILLARRDLIPLSWYASDWKSLVAMAIPLVLSLVPALIFGCLLCQTAETTTGTSIDGKSTRQREMGFWLGVVVSWAVLPSTLFVRLAADQVLTILSGCLLLGAAVSLFLRSEEHNVAARPADDLPSQPTGKSIDTVAGYPLVVLAANALLVGFATEAANRTTEQLVLELLPLKLFGWAGFLLGILVGLTWSSRTNDDRRVARRSLLLTAASACAVLTLFPAWMRLAIWSSANLGSMPSIIAAKGCVVAGILGPCGIAAGSILGVARRRGWLAILMGAGYAICTLVSPQLARTELTVTCIAGGLMLTLWPMGTWRGFARERLWNRQLVPIATCCCLMAMAVTCSGWLDPVRSAASVFHGDTFVATSRGFDLRTIEQTNRGRCLKTIQGENGVWTLWRQHANQLIVRRNGIHTDQMSIDTTLGPQDFWSVVASALPVVTHPKTDHVLCLGTPGLVEINTLLGFPIQTLTCVEADRDVRAILDYSASMNDTNDRLSDSRLEWVEATPAQFAASGNQRQYDVILCPESTAIPMKSHPQLTREFYARVEQHLSEGGIFCQRMNVDDFGATPICDLMQSIRSAFAQVSIVTTTGSDLLLLASNTPEPLFDPSLLSRLETPHMRHLCSTIGADWSVVTQLACIPAHQVEDILALAPRESLSCANAKFLLTVGPETLRWGPKWKEKQGLFANRAELILKEAQLKETDEQTVARRILDAQERTRILTQRAEDEWSYRTTLRDALKSRPRTTIQRVNKEIRQTLTADDKHRKEYLVALGRAAREEVPPLDAIARIETFASPYDPLLTDFVHFEAAHLMERAKDADPARIYRHWMHCVTYAPTGDQSIRPVAAAMNLLRAHPEIEPDPAWRWDQFNLLLDVMRTRWSNRWQAATPSKYESADLQHSIEAVNGTLSAMNDLQPQAGLDRESWRVQRRVWEESLVGPIHARQNKGDARSEMLETVRQEWLRRNSELSETKSATSDSK